MPTWPEIGGTVHVLPDGEGPLVVCGRIQDEAADVDEAD